MTRKIDHMFTMGGGRTLLLAAALAALIGALFAAVPPAQADPGDITWGPNLTPIFQGFCTQPTVQEYVVTTGTLANTWRFQVEDETGARVDVSCPEPGLPVIVTPNGTTSPDITPLQPKLELRADNAVVTAGQSVTITAFLRNVVRRTETLGADNVAIARLHHNSAILAPTAPDADLASNGFHPDSIRIDWAYTSGELDDPTIPAAGTTLANNTFPLVVEVPRGTTPGEYTVSVSVTYDQYSGADYYDVSNLRTLTASTTITVSDEPFAHLAEAELALAYAMTDDLSTSVDETVPESGTTSAAGGEVWLRLNLRDALGEPIRPDNLSRLTVFAPGAELALHGPIGDFGVPQPYLPSNPRQRFMPSQPDDAILSAGTNTTPLNAPNILSTMYIKVSKADGEPGTVDVQAIVSSPSGVAESETITLTFTGPAAAVALGGDVELGQPPANTQTQREIALSATDAAGNQVAPGAVNYQVTDADGQRVRTAQIMVESSTAGSSTARTVDDNPNAPVALLTVDDSAEPGVYTVTASLSGVADSSDSVMVTISGAPASLTLSADKTSSAMVGDVITATATVADAAGAAVANGTEVTFTVSGTGLVVVGTDANPVAPGSQSRTAGGAAIGEFAVVGAGTAVINALINGLTEIVIVTSTAGAATAEEESLLDCLGGRRAFTSWTCSESSNASAVLRELAEGGATTLYLSNGASWVRYSMVDGREVPGSLDFTIFEHDILYVGY